MRHYKQSADNYILSIGTGYGGEEITESEYNEIMAVIKSCPHLDGKGYRLKTDLTWETYDVPPTTGTPPATEHIKRIDDDCTPLATPVTTPIQSSGTIVSYPSGTVYIEKVIADAGVYDSGITVLNTGRPIATLESISKIDYTTGQETAIEVSTAVIAADGLSFTHPDLSDGDIVFFTYFYDTESTVGETTLTYYDSRYVIKNEDDGKFYQWAIKASGTPPTATIELEEA